MGGLCYEHGGLSPAPRTAILIVLALLASGCGEDATPRTDDGEEAARVPAAGVGRQVAQTLEASGRAGRVRMNYLLYLPRDYGRQRGRRWPLLLFLHGAGHRGSTLADLERLESHGIPKVLRERVGLPFVAVSPQTASYWVPQRLAALLDEVQRRYAVDRRRVYATGLSLGGYGTWDLATAYPHRFAAIAPIAGGGGLWSAAYQRRTCRLRDVAVWAFHGARDTVVLPRESQAMVSAVRRCGGEARLTLYADAAHDSGRRTYDDPRLYRWLLRHSRRSARAPTRGAR